ncbi:HDOD domain-containing protein [Burkholderiaceae bacterium DAT-1]|nr:HDOD domain-containing protein [Burkholderiaceae bacterium DAT-1]
MEYQDKSRQCPTLKNIPSAKAVIVSADLNEAKTDKLLKSLTLPPLPSVLADFRAAQAKEADLQTLGQIIGRDIGLAAAVLKVANSPGFAGRTLDSLKDAVTVLGAANLESIVTSVALKQLLPLPPILHTFWEESGRIGSIASQAAKTWHLCRPDQAYLFCLFRDSGIPVLAQRFSSYINTLARAMADPVNFTQIEERSRATAHTVVGYLLARTWFMPEHFAEGVLMHHDFAAIGKHESVSREAARLVSTARLAEHLLRAHVLNELDLGWPQAEQAVLGELGIHPSEMEEFGDELRKGPSLV